MYSQYPSGGTTNTAAAHNAGVMYATPCYPAGSAPGVGVASQFSTCTDSFRRQDIFPGSMTNATTAADIFSSYHDKFYYPTSHHSQVRVKQNCVFVLGVSGTPLNIYYGLRYRTIFS